jgi:leucyl/phenylalanyl-tRNA--protein transferase
MALIALSHIVGEAGGIIDCQFETPHLLSMGGRHITYDEYMDILGIS